MARRGTPGRSTRNAAVIGAVVMLIGIAAGVFLARGVPLGPRQTAPPAPTPPVSAPPTPTPPEQPSVIAVDDRDLDAAVRRALGQIGAVVQSTDQERSLQRGQQLLRWHSRTVAVRPRGTIDDAVALLGKEVQQAGGKVFSRSPTGVRIGVVRDGQPLLTHEVQFVPFRAQARVAIIFDDAGGSLADLDVIIALHRPVAVAVLPGLRFSKEVAERARAAGLEVLLHLPIEPEDPTKQLGPGGITTAMSEEEIIQTVRADLATIPGALGVNNHMGSRGTADERVMRAVLAVVKERGLIFVDSVTSPRSIAARVASEMQIRTAARQVFLDNEDEETAIRRQVLHLITLARQRKEAVAIGHAHRLTATVLQGMLAEFDRQGVEIVPVSTIVR